ncbi:cytochrome b-c1 complex subunit 7 [Ciona intestinalis]
MSAARQGLQVAKKITSLNAVNLNWQIGKYPNQLGCIHDSLAPFQKKLHKIDYVGSGYCKIGLLNHDMLNETDPIVQEARLRMTEDEIQGRYFRLSRALLLSANHQILPTEQWTPMDSDHNYLQPHINAVKQETQERLIVKCALLDFEDLVDRVFLIPFRLMNYFEIKNIRQKLKVQGNPKLI